MQGFVPRFPAPLDPRLLQSIRNRVSLGFKGEFPNYKKLPDVSPKEASVLVPLCNFNNRFSILYTLRSMKVSTHKGQVSFPGGVRDSGGNIDVTLLLRFILFPGESLATCCLRECEEEIGIKLSHSDLIGQLPSGRSISGMKVTPFVAFLGELDPAKLQLSTDEISEAFCVGVDDLLDDSKVEMQDFSGGWTIPRYTGGAHPIWGLTAYITQYFLKQVLLPAASPNASEATASKL